MKFIIVGKNAAGKHRVSELCQEAGMKVGKEFSNIPKLLPEIYMNNYEKYSSEDISTIFESNSYICINSIEEDNVPEGYMYYRGISLYTWDNNEVFVMSPQQVCNLNKKNIGDDIVFIWMDSNREYRLNRHRGRTYSFTEVDKRESQFDKDMVNSIYGMDNSEVLYFNNEEPDRVAAIVVALYKYPDLLDMFVESFK